jgi:hypothetical protein
MLKGILMRCRLQVCFGLAITIFLPVIYDQGAPVMQETSQPQQTCCRIIELRQYTLHPGKRDVLIDLFDREFVETQEAVGMSIIGQFRDLDKPDRFVWLRGFPDMPSRPQSLTAFYGGPVWKKHSAAANATMIDSDNVLLLRQALPTSGFSFKKSDRPQLGSKEVDRGLVIATIYYFNAPVSQDFVDFFERTVKPVVTDTGVAVDAYFVTENSANNFPRLPVREGEHVFVWFMRFADQASYEHHVAALSASKRWRSKVAEELARRLKGAPEVLKLSPTSRSRLRGLT